jgi:hypothetical protein
MPVAIPQQTWSYALHRDGRTLAMAAGRVWLVDGGAMRITDSRRVRGGVTALAWVGDHLAVLTQTAVVWLDRSGRRVSTTDLPAAPVRSAGTADGFVVLTEHEADARTPPALTWSAPDAHTRTVALDRVVAGHVPDEGEFGASIVPGLAVDDTGDRAVIVQSDAPIADVDLSTMAVTYHDDQPMGLTSSAEAKLSDWSSVEAEWLADGLVAVWGTKSINVAGGGGTGEIAAGLSLVNARTWATCEIDPTVVDVALSDGLMFARATGAEGRNDDALVAYDSAGRELWRRFGHRRMFDIDAYGRFVYATTSWDGWIVRILDAATGEFLGVRRHRPPTLTTRDSHGSTG